MGNIVHEMCDQVPETFFRLNVLLAADMAKPAMNRCLAIQTNLFLSFG
jgi:hypothetical protein